MPGYVCYCRCVNLHNMFTHHQRLLKVLTLPVYSILANKSTVCSIFTNAYSFSLINSSFIFSQRLSSLKCKWVHINSHNVVILTHTPTYNIIKTLWCRSSGGLSFVPSYQTTLQHAKCKNHHTGTIHIQSINIYISSGAGKFSVLTLLNLYNVPSY